MFSIIIYTYTKHINDYVIIYPMSFKIKYNYISPILFFPPKPSKFPFLHFCKSMTSFFINVLHIYLYSHTQSEHTYSKYINTGISLYNVTHVYVFQTELNSKMRHQKA